MSDSIENTYSEMQMELPGFSRCADQPQHISLWAAWASSMSLQLFRVCHPRLQRVRPLAFNHRRDDVQLSNIFNTFKVNTNCNSWQVFCFLQVCTKTGTSVTH